MDEQQLNEKKEKEKAGRGALFIPAGLFLGFGFGLLVDNPPAGMFLGLGIGFMAFALSLFFKK